MAKITTHRWVCDGCDEESSHQGSSLPQGWEKFCIKTEHYPAFLQESKEFAVCGTCFNVLFNNRRKGPTWFQRLLRVLKGGKNGSQ